MIPSHTCSSSSSSFALLALLATALLLCGQANAFPLSDLEEGGPDSNRKLSSALSPPLQVDGMIDMLQDCEALSYTVAASVSGTHFGLAAIPEQISKDCPILFLDDAMSTDIGKRISTLADGTPSLLLEGVPKYELGSFSLETILDAFHKAADSSGEAYDLLQNNCVTFIISMMEDGLSIPVTSDHLAFAAENVLEDDKDKWITTALRAHKLYKTMFPRGDLTPDLSLMYEFVTDYYESHRKRN